MPQPLLTRPPSPLTAQSLQVYLALWHETEVACKVLLAGGSAGITSSGDAARALALSSPIMHQLEEEAGLLAALRHPNVIQFCEMLLPLSRHRCHCCCRSCSFNFNAQWGRQEVWTVRTCIHMLALVPAPMLQLVSATSHPASSQVGTEGGSSSVVQAVHGVGLPVYRESACQVVLPPPLSCSHPRRSAPHALVQQSTVLAAACTRC